MRPSLFLQNSNLLLWIAAFTILAAYKCHSTPTHLNEEDEPKYGQVDDDNPDLADQSESVTPSSNPVDKDDDDVATYLVKGYTVQSQGIPDVSLHTSQIDGELVIKGLIGMGGTVTSNVSTSNVVLQIDQGVKEGQGWILVQPPPEIDVGLIHWERDDDRIFISGPLIVPSQSQGQRQDQDINDDDSSQEIITSTDSLSMFV